MSWSSPVSPQRLSADVTLHSAIEEVLKSAGRALTAREVADEVNRRGLYVRGDGTPLPPGQVSARVRKYPGLFASTGDGIWLAGREVTVSSPFARGAGRSQSDSGGSTASAPTDNRTVELESSLMDPTRFRSARDIDRDVPDRFGLYAIRVRNIRLLPEPYRSAAADRRSTLIYIGEATGQTLRSRFLRNELRGRGHGTFFRSIGAVLGYRPPTGSLVGKSNQRNFRFSPADTAVIVDWINANLDVSWVAFDEGVHAAEVELIRKHTPLLNLRDNPAALPELSALRSLCCEIAVATP
jgi:hypothetical protein